MACACRKNKNLQYVWTDGVNTVIYETEMAARAKVLRKGGSYKPRER